MATVQELLRNPGPFITKLLPVVQELVKNNNPYQINHAAKIVFDKQKVWGGGSVYSRVAQYPLKNTNPIDREVANTVLIKNFEYLMNSFPMGEYNSWLEFQKFVDLFYQLLNPITYFTQNVHPSLITGDWCPPFGSCLDGTSYYTARIGAYRRPQLPGEGTGFKFTTTRQGAVGVEEEFTLFYYTAISPAWCPPFGSCLDLVQLENRYFTVGTGGPTANDILVVWFNTGTGVQPVVPGPGAVNYLEVTLNTTGTMEYVQTQVENALVAQGAWTIVSSDPGHHVTLYKAATTGVRTDAADGRNGFSTPNQTMRASDNTVIANNLVTDTAWQNAHNDLRVPYEKQAFDDDYMYLKSIAGLPDNVIARGECPPLCCLPASAPGCFVSGFFLMTPAIGILTEIPINTKVIRGISAGNNRKIVIG